MAIMMGKLYSALIAANVSEDAARAAAEEIAGFDSLRVDISDLRGKVNLLTWMVGFNLALVVAIAMKLLLHS